MDCNEILRRHTTYLSEGFSCERSGDGEFTVVTPYKLPDGDLVELVVEERPEGMIRVRDLGETVATLSLQGFDFLASDKRRWLFDQAIRQSGVEVDQGELRKDGPAETVGALLLDVAAASRAVADLIYLHRSMAPQDFDQRVVSFLADHAVEVQPRVRVKGLSGHEYRVTARAFREDGQQLLVQTLAPRTRAQAKGVVDRAVRQWVDVNHDVDRLHKLSFLNDATVEWPAADVRLLSRFSVVTGWRIRHQLFGFLEGRAAEPDIELALSLWDAFDDASDALPPGEDDLPMT